MTAFQIHQSDNVATALEKLETGSVLLRGDANETSVETIEEIPDGHKIAVRDIKEGEPIVKYGVVIGKAVKDIKRVPGCISTICGVCTMSARAIWI